MELICPKCHGAMRTYERNGVHVDQCSDCRGIFLDRGELERLIDAENDWHGRTSSGHGTAAAHGTPGHASSGGYGAGAGTGGLGAVVGEVLNQVQGKKHSSSGHGGKRKQSFLDGLFG
ncbi:TFIIB-type zinc ribbon-containing protein [Geodermatophilus sp. SYSU D01105]